MLCKFDLKYILFLKNYLTINYWATRNLLGHPDLQRWVPGWAFGKKILNHRLYKFVYDSYNYCKLKPIAFSAEFPLGGEVLFKHER